MVSEFEVAMPGAAERGITIGVARSVSEVEALREAWTSWNGHRDSDIDFYLMIVGSYPEVERPHVLALYRDGVPEAVMIGRLEKKRVGFRLGYFRAVGWKARCLTFVYGPVHGNHSAECLDMLMSAVIECLRRGEADVAVFEFLPVDNPLYGLALRAPDFLSRDNRPPIQGHESMTIPLSIEEVYGRMSGTRRKHLRRSIRQIESDVAGRPDVLCYRDPSELAKVFVDVEEIARRTYQRGLGVGFADNGRVRSRLTLGAKKGWLRAYVLYLGGRPAAFWIGMVYRGTFVSEYLGFDPEFRNLSPGMFLVMKVLERLCDRAAGDVVDRLDFGLGDAEYKRVLADNAWQEASVYIFSTNCKGLGLKLLRVMANLTNEVAVKGLAAANVLPRFKRKWRDRLASGNRAVRSNSTNSPIGRSRVAGETES